MAVDNLQVQLKNYPLNWFPFERREMKFSFPMALTVILFFVRGPDCVTQRDVHLAVLSICRALI